MTWHRVCAILGGCLPAMILPAQTSAAGPKAEAIVDRVQTPAWIERHGMRQKLSTGLVLRNRDHLITGPGARLRIQLGDGSVVGLGADSRLELNALGVRERDVFTAALDLRQGTLRFSTGALARSVRQRAVNLRVGSITATIRGTDLWGSADQDGDRICLLEGGITVVHPQAEAQQMDQPLRCYNAPKGEAPLTLEIASQQQLSAWTAQTDPPFDRRSDPRQNKWGVEVATVDSESAALALYDRLRDAGYEARIKPQPAAGGTYRYSVRLTRLTTGNEAAELAKQFAPSLPIPSPTAIGR
ncbi:FecR domain-containing protein [Accumulibacter sp.]|uniref:FecR domain-containing protein n=1 Tax=Accumulibacter sp. TaxID=2053492 RepID=UPI002638E227|nr:FecR domain-containing protein [Accumulibacter sp.]